MPITNQDCTMESGTSEKPWYAKLPYLKKEPLNIGCLDEKAVLKEAKVTPNNGRYILSFVFEIPEKEHVVSESSSRIAAVDPGIDRPYGDHQQRRLTMYSDKRWDRKIHQSKIQ